jgi:hypothetical protein
MDGCLGREKRNREMMEKSIGRMWKLERRRHMDGKRCLLIDTEVKT